MITKSGVAKLISPQLIQRGEHPEKVILVCQDIQEDKYLKNKHKN